MHTVGHRAAELAEVPKVFEATMNREHIVRLIMAAREAGAPIGDEEFDPNSGADDGNPFGMAEEELTLAVDVTGLLARQARVTALPPQPDHRHQLLPGDARRGVLHSVRNRVVHRKGRRAGSATWLAVRMTRLYLVRHGRATAGWDTDPDPGLDDIGTNQAAAVAQRLAPLGPMPVITSPLRRCRETAAYLAGKWHLDALVEQAVAEIPSPEGVDMADRVEWLRVAMAGAWADLGPRYLTFRDEVVRFLCGRSADSVVFSHFIAINAAIGAALGDDRLVVRSLDNCSVTVVDVIDGALQLVESGHEADTLIR